MKKSAPKIEALKMNESCESDVEIKDSQKDKKICPYDINVMTRDSPSDFRPQDERWHFENASVPAFRKVGVEGKSWCSAPCIDLMYRYKDIDDVCSCSDERK